MNFSKVLAELGGRLDAAGIRYVLIGGFAMRLFKLEDRLPELKSTYGPPQ